MGQALATKCGCQAACGHQDSPRQSKDTSDQLFAVVESAPALPDSAPLYSDAETNSGEGTLSSILTPASASVVLYPGKFQRDNESSASAVSTLSTKFEEVQSDKSSCCLDELPNASRMYFGTDLLELEDLKAQEAVDSTRPYTFRSGAEYKGQWLQNERHGFGHQTWPDGATYRGQWVHNIVSGMGRFEHPDGEVYIGEWSGFLANGLGTYYHIKNEQIKSVFQGEWRNDEQHGLGVELLDSGSRYAGFFSSNEKSGVGSYQWADGSHFEGYWINGAMHGSGAYTAVDGRKFQGQLHINTFHGFGQHLWPDGQKYHGYYARDQKHGFGILSLPDGTRCQGDWVYGRQPDAEKETESSGSSRPSSRKNGLNLIV